MACPALGGEGCHEASLQTSSVATLARVAGVAEYVDDHARMFSFLGTGALAGVAWLTISRGLAEAGAPGIGGAALGTVAAAAGAAHLLFLGLNLLVMKRFQARTLRLQRQGLGCRLPTEPLGAHI